MASLIAYLNTNGLGHFTSNLYGLYLPLFITIILLFFSYKEFLKKENLILFVLGLIGCFILSYGKTITSNNYINGVEIPITYNQFHSVNVFGLLYLIRVSLPLGKDIKMNYSVMWIGSFITLWIVDGWYAFSEFGKNWFSSSIGGAGIFDCLLLTPIVSIIGIFFIQAAHNYKYKQNKKETV